MEKKTKEKIKPIDLGHLWDKLISVKRNLEVFNSSDRSEDFKKKKLESAVNIIDVCIRDIEYLLDEKDINNLE